MQFQLTKTAERELDQIFVYYAQRAGVDVADKIIDSIEERFALLGDFPAIGLNSDHLVPGVLRFPTGDYIVYYRKRRNVIQILHILHGARNQARTFKNN
ncbi:MAG: type II toxin-antitoxin system RelE/ParE family toxin [Terracidiphilus sp.]